MKSGTNLRRVGDYNRQLVLESIRVKRLSRVEIARETGLTAQTITNIVRRLLDEGLVLETNSLLGGETGNHARRVGKPRVGLEINARARHALGIHIDRHESHIALLDLSGALTEHQVCKTDLNAGPEGIVEQLAVASENSVRRSGIDPSSIVGLGAASPGPLNLKTGEVLGPLGMPGWERVPLKQMLEEHTGLETVLENDAVASAVGEKWGGVARGTRNFMFVYIGWGMGAGLFMDAQIYRGSSGTAGEIAHLPVDPHGPKCWCGKRGCLIRLCASATIVDAVSRRGHESVTIGDTYSASEMREAHDKGNDASFTDEELNEAFSRVCKLAASGDPLARDELERVGVTLGTTLAGLVDLLDLELIVLGGSVFEKAREIYLPRIQHCIPNMILWKDRREVRVEASHLGSEVGAVGAASVVLHNYFAPQVTGLELSVG